jgi:pyruvate,water dikinase
VLNFAQFSATMNLNGVVAQVKGEGDHSALLGRLQSSTVNRNWDSIEELWNIKEKVKTDPHGDVASAFHKATAVDVIRDLEQTEAGRAFLAQDIEGYSREFGFKSMYAHEFSFKSWRENPAPIIEAIRGYLESDYDYPAEIAAVAEDLEAAKVEVMEGVEGEDRDTLAGALDLSLRMNPLTPDHHFYIDQGTNARVRIVLVAIGRKLVAEGKLGDPEDVMYLRYNELRTLMAGSNGFDAEELVGDRRDAREDAYELRPRDWVGTATEENVAFPYLSLWAFPEKLYRKPSTTEGEIMGLAASVGVIEGTARVVLSPEQFAEVQKDEIVVCRMTSPAWVVLFTKIGGLVTDAGGMASHPAVVSREFGIPAVVGTSDATRQIKTGDRVRVNGATGVVQVLS